MNVPNARFMTVSGFPLCLGFAHGLPLIIYAYSRVTMQTVFHSLVGLAAEVLMIMLTS